MRSSGARPPAARAASTGLPVSARALLGRCTAAWTGVLSSGLLAPRQEEHEHYQLPPTVHTYSIHQGTDFCGGEKRTTNTHHGISPTALRPLPAGGDILHPAPLCPLPSEALVPLHPLPSCSGDLASSIVSLHHPPHRQARSPDSKHKAQFTCVFGAVIASAYPLCFSRFPLLSCLTLSSSHGLSHSHAGATCAPSPRPLPFPISPPLSVLSPLSPPQIASRVANRTASYGSKYTPNITITKAADKIAERVETESRPLQRLRGGAYTHVTICLT
jgi:hypothetical protein